MTRSDRRLRALCEWGAIALGCAIIVAHILWGLRP